MKNYHFGNYEVEIDKSATKKWYETYDGWECKCSLCLNFLELAHTKKLPSHILEILNELDISPEKATYVCELYTDDVGIHNQFSYRIVGTIIDVPGKEESDNNIVCRCWHDPYPYGAPNFPEPNFDLEFYATLPYVLNEVPN